MTKHTPTFNCPSTLVRAPIALLAATMLLAFVSLTAMAASPPPASASRPVVTLDRLVAEVSTEVSGLRWLGDTHLVGNLKTGKKTAQTVWPVDGGKPSLLAPGEGARVSPDGKKFITREKDDWVVRELQGERRELARVPGTHGDNPRGTLAWSRDSQQIALAQEVRARANPPTSVLKEGEVRYEDLGALADAKDASGIAASTITLLDLRTTEAPRRYPFTGLLNAMEWGGSDDLYFVVQPLWNTGGVPPATVVRVLQRGEQREVFRVGGIMQDISPSISPDGRWMSVICDIDSQVWDDFTSLLVVELSSGKTRRLTQDKHVAGGAVWAPDSRSLAFRVRDGGWTQLYQATIEGKLTAVTDTPTLKREMQLSPNGKLLAYAAYNGLGVAELRVVDVQTRRDRQIALLNDPGSRYQLGRFERVKFPTADGLSMAAWIVYPPDFDSARKYPLYIDVHGGGPGSFLYLSAPISAMVAHGPLEWHAWAARGYLVFVPDYRSSGEYGPGVAAARHRNGDYSGIQADVRDIEAGTAWMLKRPYVDATRVGLFGASAGGARVNLLLTRSATYRAGVMHDAVGAGVLPDYLSASIGSNAGTTGSKAFWSARLGDMVAQPQAYLGGFLFDGYKSNTPTLILVGDRNAGALNPLSAEVLFSTLRRKGVPARMLRYTDDGHGFHTPASATHAFKEVASWFATHMNMATDDKGNIVFEGNRVKDAKPPAAGQ